MRDAKRLLYDGGELIDNYVNACTTKLLRISRIRFLREIFW